MTGLRSILGEISRKRPKVNTVTRFCLAHTADSGHPVARIGDRMKRRTLLTALPAALCLPRMALAYAPVPYAPDAWKALRETDATFVLNFRASWSLTCARKAEILAALLAENPTYESLRFVEVDWDTFGPSVWVDKLKVERRSTLIAMRKGREIARVVNQPDIRLLRAFLDTAIDA